MAQPPPYNRQASFTNLQALNPTGQPPGNLMDAEYNAIKTTLDAIDTNLALIQNDDGTLANGVVGPAQLSSEFLLGFTPPMAWVTGHAYTASPASTVLQGTALYICTIPHTSGTFATDLALGRWLKVLDLSTLTFGNASQIAVSAHGTNILTNVQTSLNNLEDNKAALSHTHTAAQISDSTVAGRAFLTALTVSAQQTLLGLGTLAFLNTIPAVTAITNQLAFTGAISSSLVATNNDLIPTGWTTNSVAKLTSTAAFTITGFSATSDGDYKIIQNVSAFVMTLAANSASSSAGNRIALVVPKAIPAGGAVAIQYDATAAIWRVLGMQEASPVVGSLKNLRVGNVANFLGDSAPATPNNQAYINYDEIVLENSLGNSWRVSSGALTIDGTVQNAANGTDGTYSIGASAWYSLWVIGNPATGTAAGLIGTSATAPTLPSGYTFKARVGWMRTDGSSHFLKSLQYGRTARYTGTMPAITGASGAATATPSIINYVPSTATKIAVILAGAVLAGQSASVSATASSSPLITVTNATGGGSLTANSIADFNLEASTISYASTTAGTAVSCYGWEDNI